jgi:hypothetical protein
MMKPEPIAVRTLWVAGTRRRVTIRIFQPESVDGEEHFCDFTIVGRGITVKRRSYGYDAVQALELVFRIIEASLIRLEDDHDIKFSVVPS